MIFSIDFGKKCNIPRYKSCSIGTNKISKCTRDTARKITLYAVQNNFINYSIAVDSLL